ncbi:MAG: methylated-DNA--[protein]-cysteine S-methyltransferase [Geminicoccaceae bacterium]
MHVEGRDFETTVWRALRQIACGTTWSYARLAASIGRPTAVRAAGAANGRNPISLVLPCHRVIGADGRLVGYGGGLERKAWLLRLRRAGRLNGRGGPARGRSGRGPAWSGSPAAPCRRGPSPRRCR